MAVNDMELSTLRRKKVSLETQRIQYKDSLNYAKKLVDNLQDSMVKINYSENYLKSYFTIDGKTADGGKLDSIRTEIKQTIKILNNTVIPNINLNINKLTKEISEITKKINEIRNQVNM